MKILKILANPIRRKILKLCSKEPQSMGVLERKLGVSHNAVWRHVAILQKDRLLKCFKFFTKDYRKLKHYVGGRPYFKLVETTISKKHIQEMEKELNWMKKFKK